MLPETPVFYMQLQHQGNPIEMVLLSIFFTTNQIHGGSSAHCSLFILMLHALLHLAVKILLQIFLYEDLHRYLTYIYVGCISLQNASRTALCYAPILLSENIFAHLT